MRLSLPNDPVMLLSVVNTALRDKYSSLEDYAESENFDLTSVEDKLSQIGYSYNKEQNKFV